MRHFFPLLFLTVILTGCAGTREVYPSFAEYIVVPGAGVSLEADHPRYDAALGGFWLAGNGTVLIEPGVPEPGSGLVLSIRNQPDPKAPPAVAMIRVVTPEHVIVMRYRDRTISLTKPEDQSAVQILSDTGYIEMTREGNRMVVKFSAEFLRRHAPHGAAVTWFDSAR